MPNTVADTLSAAKGALAHANAAFPSTPTPEAAPTTTSAPAAKPAPSIGEELKVKKTMVDKAMSALPKMHDGGPVAADGAYQLKAGEHVLTAPQAKMARKHALMAIGMRSLAKPAPSTAGEPTTVDAAHKKPEKKMTSGITVRPEKKQAAKISMKKK